MSLHLNINNPSVLPFSSTLEFMTGYANVTGEGYYTVFTVPEGKKYQIKAFRLSMGFLADYKIQHVYLHETGALLEIIRDINATFYNSGLVDITLGEGHSFRVYVDNYVSSGTLDFEGYVEVTTIY